jgi:two-component system, NtrC family, response regulator HydG
MQKEKVLIVEDEELMRAILRELLTNAGYDVFSADSAETALTIFAENEIAVTLTDIKMPGRDGLELLAQLRNIDNSAVVIVMTAFSSVDTAISALRKGAYDYITKPFINDELLQAVKNAANQRKLYLENKILRRQILRQNDASDIIGNSPKLLEVLDLVKRVAPTDASVVIHGESGTGKELIARALHSGSDRRDRPFLAINCGALAESLLESELFGHVKGSFTGATSDEPGLLLSASGGTIFLDEIGEMSEGVQVKLLRAIQEHEVLPVGSSRPLSFDARIVSASNKDLDEECAAGRFRDDLYYRLNVIEVRLPPLRERRSDIPLLAKHFIENRSAGGTPPTLSEQASLMLLAYEWPGNIRELENVIERAVILADDEITPTDLPNKISELARDAKHGNSPMSLENIEKAHILEVLADTDGDKAAAAEILEIDLSTLYRKLKRYESDRSFRGQF